jgi:Ser/Thr protein kinase RdoA (MazF antagonist)
MNTLLSQKAVLEFVKANYSLDEPQTCEFIRRGFNDHYQLTAGNEQYIFRVYLNGKYYIDSPEAFQFELDLVDYLYKQEIPVARPLPQSNGELLGCIDTDLGKRYTALFSYASGESLSYALGESPPGKTPTVEQCADLGKTIGAFHLAANDFQS